MGLISSSPTSDFRLDRLFRGVAVEGMVPDRAIGQVGFYDDTHIMIAMPRLGKEARDFVCRKSGQWRQMPIAA